LNHPNAQETHLMFVYVYLTLRTQYYKHLHNLENIKNAMFYTEKCQLRRWDWER